MGGSGAGGKWPWACGMLLLLGGALASAVPLEGGSSGQDNTEVSEIKRNGLLTFLTWWHEWTSQASTGARTGGDVTEVSKRQEGPLPQQPPRREKTPCKNFFWKTFSCE